MRFNDPCVQIIVSTCVKHLFALAAAATDRDWRTLLMVTRLMRRLLLLLLMMMFGGGKSGADRRRQ